MVKLDEKMKTAFSKVKIFPVATASKDGIPNVVPIGFCQLVDDETIWISDNFMSKSLANLKENPNVAVYVWGPDTGGCFQIKGKAEIISSGDKFEKNESNRACGKTRTSCKEPHRSKDYRGFPVCSRPRRRKEIALSKTQIILCRNPDLRLL
ncbi:pyridoxamine 5'-phosphate oxidase family protein [Methanosarcina barkeri]